MIAHTPFIQMSFSLVVFQSWCLDVLLSLVLLSCCLSVLSSCCLVVLLSWCQKNRKHLDVSACLRHIFSLYFLASSCPKKKELIFALSLPKMCFHGFCPCLWKAMFQLLTLFWMKMKQIEKPLSWKNLYFAAENIKKNKYSHGPQRQFVSATAVMSQN